MCIRDRTWDHARLLAGLQHKVAEIESLEARLAHSKVQLMALMRDVGTRPDGTCLLYTSRCV